MSERARSTSLPEALRDALEPIPIPIDPRHFLGTFCYAHIEDDTGQLPAKVQHNDLVGQIPLYTTVDEKRGVILFKGDRNPDIHPVFKIPFSAHENGGMCLVLKSKNRHKHAFAENIWKRDFTKRQMQTLLTEKVNSKDTLTVFGHAPCIPYGRGTSTARLWFEECKGNYYIQRVEVEMTFAVYDAWVWALTH